MKNGYLKYIFVFFVIIVMTGCFNHNNNVDKIKFEKDFGSYELLDGWVENKKHSTKQKFFYTLKSDANKSRPNNISVNVGTNKYSKDEHEKFKVAILSQLNMQTSSYEGINLNGEGFTSDNGYIVYKFTIYEENSDTTTTQYYIIGDYKYVLVHETTFGKSEKTDEAAIKIVNSFKWKE